MRIGSRTSSPASSILLLGLLVGACSAGGNSRTGGVDPGTGAGGGGTSGGGSSGNGSGAIIGTPDPPAPPGCGDGTLTSDEACDDGNKRSGDGCAANCLQVERGFSCAI